MYAAGPIAAMMVGICPAMLDALAGSAQNILVRDIDTGCVLYSRNPDTLIGPHSTLKSMTALLVIERKGNSLDDTITITSADVSGLTNISVMGLQANDVISWRHLLYGIMLASGSDACQAVARVIGTEMFVEAGSTGSTGVARFVEAMNTRAQQLRMSSTTYTDSYGRFEAGQRTTARDSARLIEVAFTNPTLQTIAGAASFTAVVTGVNARNISMNNTSPIAGTPGVLATKTGTWTEAGGATTANLISLYQAPNGNRIAVAVMYAASAPQRQTENSRFIGHVTIDYPYLDPDSTLEVTDPHFANVQLLVGAEQDPIIDQSPAARPLTLTNIVRSNVRVMGRHSMEFNGSTSWVSIPDADNLSFANVDFTVEVWLRATSEPAAFCPIISKYDNEFNRREWMLAYAPTLDRFQWFHSYNGSTAFNFTSDAFTPSVAFNGAVHHLAVTRSGSTLRMFLNGGLQANTFNIATNSLHNNISSVVIGARNVSGAPGAGGGVWPGWIDEVRITRGVARYTASFPALRRPFPRS